MTVLPNKLTFTICNLNCLRLIYYIVIMQCIIHMHCNVSFNVDIICNVLKCISLLCNF